MRSLMLQIIAVTAINLKSISQRLWLSASTVVAVALVVVVLLAFLAMANGFQRTLAGSGADDIAMIMRGGSQAEINSTVAFGATRWTVVGVFDAGGSVFESEIWADLPVVQSLFKRNNFFQTVRARLQSPQSFAALKKYVDDDPRLKLDVKTEATYF